MGQNLSLRPMILGSFAVTVALAFMFLINIEFGAAPTLEGPQGRPAPVPEPPTVALSTPEPVSETCRRA